MALTQHLPDFTSITNKTKSFAVQVWNRVSQTIMANPPTTPPTIAPTVVVGPSGVGKGTLLGQIKSLYPDTFAVAVSHTTRAPREGEINGVHYHFVDRDEFEHGIAQGNFIEYADVHGRLYGTSKQSVADVAALSKICLLEIDVQGAEKIHHSGMHANYLFVTAPGGLETLRSRLQSRHTESPEQIERRLMTATSEFEFLEKNRSLFDCVIENDVLEHATMELGDQFRRWYPWIASRHVGGHAMDSLSGQSSVSSSAVSPSETESDTATFAAN